ncbi:chromosome partitioning protein, ParB family [Pseudonocardia ammonioxydans]|uniref:Chromosome partitioning protein, ParB family n=1 Tax=Pseudonocardia ammonioxydans TaxID=260086 RepID=A0A1I5I919_PSUAM|nr:ParB/RepB/Spo0J family partition protein [Pseudonocardia ammonioxydans]SFO56799.1 chromosome partitioning protein, ParB family [Pseudonocardia ammonioxydans]
MGKRVNLAELAREEVPDNYTPVPAAPPPPAPVPHPAPTPSAEPAPEIAAAPATPEPGPDTSLLPVDAIVSNPLNQRSSDDEQDGEFYELVSTIRGHGVLQPIVVCSATAFLERYPAEESRLDGASWVALIGNRRLRAAAVAGLTRIPALVNDDRVASMYEVMLVENSHRKSLGPLHEAEAMQRLVTEAGITQRALATRIGRTPMYVSQRMALLGLIPPLREALEDGTLKVEQGRQFGSLPVEQQEAIAAAGPPYRKPAANLPAGVEPPRRTRRSIAVSSPARAAASIREVFTENERAELIRLLSEAAETPHPAPTGRADDDVSAAAS